MKAYICLGSNLGDRKKNITDALRLFKKKNINIKKISPLYKTTPVCPYPWLVRKQNDYFNCMEEVDVNFSLYMLMKKLREIESKLGKNKKHRWSGKTIDLDIIFFGNKVINNKNLKIPHTEAHKRKFVLVPLSNIAGDFVHPVFKKTAGELLKYFRNEYKGQFVKMISKSILI